jgi:hypothetical protein
VIAGGPCHLAKTSAQFRLFMGLALASHVTSYLAT